MRGSGWDIRDGALAHVPGCYLWEKFKRKLDRLCQKQTPLSLSAVSESLNNNEFTRHRYRLCWQQFVKIWP